MNITEEDKALIEKCLPEGWEEAAKEKKALSRSRKIRTAMDLLHLMLLYLMEAGSYQLTAMLMEATTGIRLNKEAVRKRVSNCAEWMQWMAHQICLKHGYAIPQPPWLGERRVLLIDATDVSLHGSQSNDYRLHYAFDLFDHTCVQMELTTVAGAGGEKLSRFTPKQGDIFVGDRIYGTIKGMEHLQEAGASFVLRLKAKAFTLYDAQGNRIDLLPRLKKLAAWEPFSLDCHYKNHEGTLRPVRIIATRKDEAAAHKADRRLCKTASKNQWKAVPKETQALAQFIVLASNLPDTPAQILELYRARWQIECVFRRLKGLFAFGDPPGKTPSSVKAWLYGKLFIAALCEALTPTEPFSPG